MSVLVGKQALDFTAAAVLAVGLSLLGKADVGDTIEITDLGPDSGRIHPGSHQNQAVSFG